MKIELESIGTIHTEFKEIEGMPIQPTGAKGVKGRLVLEDKYVDGLKDLEEFLQQDHLKDQIALVHLLYRLIKLKEIPYMYQILMYWMKHHF